MGEKAGAAEVILVDANLLTDDVTPGNEVVVRVVSVAVAGFGLYLLVALAFLFPAARSPVGMQPVGTYISRRRVLRAFCAGQHFHEAKSDRDLPGDRECEDPCSRRTSGAGNERRDRRLSRA